MAVTANINSSRPVATLINVFTVSPDRQQELLELLARDTEETMKHQPGFISANFHASLDGTRVINYAQWESEQHYHSMREKPDVQSHMRRVGEVATEAQPRLFRVVSSHPRG
jgi:quinol monooxygenase YgiN